MFKFGLFDNPSTGNLSVDARSQKHTNLSRNFASESTVLAKNENNLLPINN